MFEIFNYSWDVKNADQFITGLRLVQFLKEKSAENLYY